MARSLSSTEQSDFITRHKFHVNYTMLPDGSSNGVSSYTLDGKTGTVGIPGAIYVDDSHYGNVMIFFRAGGGIDYISGSDLMVYPTTPASTSDVYWNTLKDGVIDDLLHPERVLDRAGDYLGTFTNAASSTLGSGVTSFLSAVNPLLIVGGIVVLALVLFPRQLVAMLK